MENESFMLSPSEGKEIYERVMRELDSGRDVTPEDAAALMQAAESGYAPAQNAYANVLGNVEGNLLAALPWYCMAAQQGNEEAFDTLRELYASEALVRSHVSQYLTVQQLIELRKPRLESSGDEGSSPQGIVAGIVTAVAAGAAYFAFGVKSDFFMICLIAGFIAGVAAEIACLHIRAKWRQGKS